MTKIFLIRHGETKWNAEFRAQGSKNVQLSENGRQQALCLANRIKGYPIDVIFSSDLDRAYETAKILGKSLNLEVKSIEGLREMCFGKWEGLTHKEIETNHQEHYQVWRNNPHQAKIPDGETLLEVQSRALEALGRIISENENKNIMIISHGVTIKTILLGLLDIDLSNFYKIRQDNTSLNIIEYRNYGPVLVTLNDTSHLENIK